MKKSDLNIELMRVACAVLVIFTHVLNRYLFEGSIDVRDKVCLLDSLCIVAVPCFLMITGYFTRKGQSWVRKCVKPLPQLCCRHFSRF